MPDYLKLDDWKAQLKRNKLLSGTGISEALRTLDGQRNNGTALAFGKAVNELIAVASKAQKKFLADKASVTYMQEIVKAANKVMTTEVNVRAGEEMALGLITGLEALIGNAKNAKALDDLRQKVRAASAAVGKVKSKDVGTLSTKFADISKDDWFKDLDDGTFAEKKKEIAKVVADLKAKLA